MVPIILRNTKLISHSAFRVKKLKISNSAAAPISHNMFSGWFTGFLSVVAVICYSLFIVPLENVFRFPPHQVYFSFFVPILLAERMK